MEQSKLNEALDILVKLNNLIVDSSNYRAYVLSLKWDNKIDDPTYEYIEKLVGVFEDKFHAEHNKLFNEVVSYINEDKNKDIPDELLRKVREFDRRARLQYDKLIKEVTDYVKGVKKVPVDTQQQSTHEIKNKIRRSLIDYVKLLYKGPKEFVVALYRAIVKLIKGEKGSTRFKAAYREFWTSLKNSIGTLDRSGKIVACIGIAAFIGVIVLVAYKLGIIRGIGKITSNIFNKLKSLIAKLFGRESAEELAYIERQYNVV